MADDKPHLHVTFYMEAQPDPKATREQGRPIFHDVEMVKILIVGDPKTSLVAPAHSSGQRDPNTGEPMTYAERFPEHYRYFKDGQDQMRADGTPLSEVPWLNASRREELKAVNVRTVEGLAGLDGTMLQRLGMGARELKNKAQAWIDAAAGNAVEARLAGELASRDEQIERMQAQINQMLAGGATVTATAEPDEPDTPSNSPFETWADEDIKNWIKDNSGSRPAGNPSHKTLVAKADAVNAELAARKAA
jgi:hypothetical protein